MSSNELITHQFSRIEFKFGSLPHRSKNIDLAAWHVFQYTQSNYYRTEQHPPIQFIAVQPGLWIVFLRHWTVQPSIDWLWPANLLTKRMALHGPSGGKIQHSKIVTVQLKACRCDRGSYLFFHETETHAISQSVLCNYIDTTRVSVSHIRNRMKACFRQARSDRCTPTCRFQSQSVSPPPRYIRTKETI